MLYYGCRHKNEDYLYQEMLEQFQQDGVLTQLNVAFSRDQGEKVNQSQAKLWIIIIILPLHYPVAFYVS